ncbi:hypothetical protein ACVWZM_001705 [Bradyrhizobium sp. USDA 4501]
MNWLPVTWKCGRQDHFVASRHHRQGCWKARRVCIPRTQLPPPLPLDCLLASFGTKCWTFPMLENDLAWNLEPGEPRPDMRHQRFCFDPGATSQRAREAAITWFGVRCTSDNHDLRQDNAAIDGRYGCDQRILPGQSLAIDYSFCLAQQWWCASARSGKRTMMTVSCLVFDRQARRTYRQLWRLHP